MRLSVVFELLLVFLFLAFAAARVIDPKNTTKNVAKGQKKVTTVRQGPPNRYCACTSRMCNCCRDFSLPVVPIKGPGCASIMYVQRDTMMVTMSFGDRVLSNTTITGRTPKPICMALPGGISQFCGRIYGISRKGDQFRACLGLELRALDDIEAALRVSCFKFGPKGVKLESAPPVPAETGGKDPEDDDDDYDLDDDDDDLIGFGDDDDDGASNEDNEVDSDSVDYTGFSVLGEDILGSFFSDDSGSSSKKKKVTKKTAKPQIVAPKVSTTTRRPVLTNIRRSTVRPNRVTLRPTVNRVTKKPRPSASRPQLIQRPSASVPTVVVPQISIQTPSVQVSPKPNKDKIVVTRKPVTTMATPETTMPVMTTKDSQEKQPVITEVTYAATEATKPPVTFTIPTEKIDVTKNDIIIPQMDLEKLEAVAAIAQQDVASGVIASSALTSGETKKPQKIVTETYEAITSTDLPESVMTNMPVVTEKINSVKFVPTTVVTSSPNAEISDANRLDEIVNAELAANSPGEVTSIKNKITSFYQESTQTTFDEKEHSEGESNDEEEPEEEEKKDTLESNNVQTLVHKKDNFTIISIKKQPLKTESLKDDEEEDLLEALGDDDNEEAEEEEEEEFSQEQSQALKKKKPIHQDEASEEEEDDDENEEESDVLEETEAVDKKAKPPKTGNKKKPAESDNEEDEDDDDILSVLGDDEDDDDDDDSDDDDEDEESDDESDNTNKNKTPSTQSTTVQIKNPTVTKRPVNQQITQTVLTKKPVTQQTEQMIINKRPVVQQVVMTKRPIVQETEQTMTKKPASQQVTILTSNPMTEQTEQTTLTKKPVMTTENEPQEEVTEKVFIYKQPVEQMTEKVIMYQEPNRTSPEQVFMYKEPVNKVTLETPEKIIMYKEPVETITEKYIIYQQPNNKPAGKPVQFVYNKPNEDSKEDSNEEVLNDEDNSSEEELDDESEEEKHTVMASIMKDRPVFSNKYAEEHDLTENDDLDIEDSDDEGNDFEEDRKLKQKTKATGLSSVSSIKPSETVKNPKIFTLSDLINQRKKFEDHSKDSRPISSSRTHRRMNLDRLLQA